MYASAISLLKLAALCFYARVFSINRRFRISLWIVSGLVVAWWIQSIFTYIFQCLPINKAWEVDGSGSCVSVTQIYIAGALSNVVIDAIVLLMPLPLLWRLQLKPMEKPGITLVFSAGYLCVWFALRADSFN